MLNIFHTGGLTLGLTLVMLVLVFLFWRNIPKAMKQPYGRFTPNGWVKEKDRTPFYRVNTFWFGCVVILAYIIAMLLVASDYKGV